jgi:hypothetical protein
VTFINQPKATADIELWGCEVFDAAPKDNEFSNLQQRLRPL